MRNLLAVAVLMAGMLLVACTTPAAPPQVLQPTETPEPAFEPLPVSAPDCDYGGLLKSIEAVDEYTVKFAMCAPTPAFLSKIASPSLSIQPKEYLEMLAGGGPGSALLEKPIGTGPYRVAEWKHGEQLIFKAYDRYWGEQAKSPVLVFKWNSDPASRLLELQSGAADAIDNPAPEDFALIEADPSLKLMPRQALNVFYLGMNNTYPPYDNLKVRQAIALGIDRQRIVKTFYPAGSEVATHFTPCAIPNGCVGEEWYAFDVARARQLLTEAGFPAGFKTEIAYRDVARDYLPQPGIVAQEIKAQLKRNLNIDASVVAMESGAYMEAAKSGQLKGLHILGWEADYPDITSFLDYHFGGGASMQFGNKFDDLVAVLNQGAVIAGDDERRPYYEEANNLVKEYVPLVPIAHAGSAVAYKAKVENPQASPLRTELFFASGIAGLDTFVFMQSAEPVSLYCPDEVDGDSLRACVQVVESLYRYTINGAAAVPSLAELCEPNADLTVWTCKLRQGVTFHDGSAFDANDVVFSLLVQWDASHPLHQGNTGAFSCWNRLWGAFLNAPR